MGKINILDSNVFNMISAGEVVERPSSVVKELVENSIDAGATRIDIYVEEGGLDKIQVSDNGIGIEKEDLRSAFLPHATSKLCKITDLDSLSTLGFRGEALASISSVSNVTLITASKSQKSSSKISLSGGTVTFEGESNRAEGTLISIENLFFNTPARLKFLKKASSELHYIQDTVKSLILANPDIAITLSNEEGTILSNDGGSLQDAIYSVYGTKVADNLMPIVENERGNVRVSGYTSKVDYTKPNRTYQSIIVNGRAVQDATVQTAVERAYAQYLMKRTYPMFILDVLMPFEDVDVNVHPSKTEVRFRDKQAVFSAVYHAIEDTINQSMSNAAFGFDITQNSDGNGKNNRILPQNTDFSPIESEKPSHEYVQTHIDTTKLFNGKTQPKNYVGIDLYDTKPLQKSTLNDGGINYYDIDFTNSSNGDFNKSKSIDNSDEYSKNSKEIEYNDNDLSDNQAIFDGKIVGQIFDTYIICERGDLVYVIDQHAAHERILYDNIVKKFNVEYAQPLLIPYKLSLTGEEEEYLDKIVPNLQKLGFDIVQNDGTYLITAVPEPVSKINFGKFFSDLFDNMLNENQLTLENLLKDKLCQQACKAAIKGGESLSRAQIEKVIQNYVDENGNLPTKCPHGRPAVIAFSARDVEKMFKRIV